jgi:hypothetical protein
MHAHSWLISTLSTDWTDLWLLLIRLNERQQESAGGCDQLAE